MYHISQTQISTEKIKTATNRSFNLKLTNSDFFFDKYLFFQCLSNYKRVYQNQSSCK